MNWQRLLTEFNRDKMSLSLGIVCLIIGAILPWYKLPKPALNSFDIHLNLINYTGNISAFFFAILLIVLIKKYRTNNITRLVVWTALFLTLLFPCWLNYCFPSLDFLSNAYYQQKIAIIQHTESNFNEVQSLWKKNILLNSSSPIDSIFPSVINHASFFQISTYDQVIQEWFGYSDSFFEFAGKGWIITIVGLMIFITGIYLSLGSQSLNLLLGDFKKILLPQSLVLILLFIYMILPNFINYDLNTKWARGEYKPIISTSKVLLNFYPTLKGDIEFIKRLSSASYYGQDADPGFINFVQGLESYGLQELESAAKYFEDALERKPDYFIIRGYLATTLINLGVQAFNQRKFGEAIDLFTKVLAIFPEHLEGLYDLMLTTAVNGDFEGSALTAQKIIDNQNFFQLPNIGLIGQAYLHKAWSNYKNGNLDQAWLKYRQSVDKSAWK